MVEVTISKPQNINVKTVHVHCKVRDEFSCTLQDENSQVVLDYEGYVPSFMPGAHYGDYVDLLIDMDTGVILNWQKVNPRELAALFENNENRSV